MTLHHKVYDCKLYGKEPDDHLIPLCGHHHHELHDAVPLSSNMEDLTREYIVTARQLEASNIEDLSWV